MNASCSGHGKILAPWKISSEENSFAFLIHHAVTVRSSLPCESPGVRSAIFVWHHGHLGSSCYNMRHDLCNIYPLSTIFRPAHSSARHSGHYGNSSELSGCCPYCQVQVTHQMRKQRKSSQALHENAFRTFITTVLSYPGSRLLRKMGTKYMLWRCLHGTPWDRD